MLSFPGKDQELVDSMFNLDQHSINHASGGSNVILENIALLVVQASVQKVRIRKQNRSRTLTEVRISGVGFINANGSCTDTSEFINKKHYPMVFVWVKKLMLSVSPNKIFGVWCHRFCNRLYFQHNSAKLASIQKHLTSCRDGRN